MPILALDTATLVSSVALTTPDTLVAELTIQTKLTHSELLMPHIDQLLTAARVQKNALKAIAVSIGPGSFTGLRIGLASAKAMAYALKLPIVGVPTLQALAFNCPVPGIYLAPLLDAQKGNVYFAVYSWQNGEFREVKPASVGAFDQVLEELIHMDQQVIVMGESAVMYGDRIKQAGGKVTVAPPHMVMPRAASVGLVGYQMFNSGIQHEVMTMEPLYIRRSEAEELWEQRHGAC